MVPTRSTATMSASAWLPLVTPENQVSLSVREMFTSTNAKPDGSQVAFRTLICKTRTKHPTLRTK
jgi:hypothetical protein